MKSEAIKNNPDDDDASRSARSQQKSQIHGWIVTALFVLAVFYTLYLTRDLTLPIVLALLLQFLLRPIVRALQRVYVPVYVASGLVVVGLVGSLALAGYWLSEPVAQWVQKSPQIVRQLERKLRPIKEKVEEVDKAAEQVEKITKRDQPTTTPTVQVRNTPSIRAVIWERVEPLITGILVLFFLLYFLLATGETMIQRLAALSGARNQILEITNSIERNVSGYLGSVTLINAGLGVCTAILTYAFGMPNPLLWGAMAMVFNFVPYVGSMVTLVVLAIVALLTFDSLSYALLVPACFLIIGTIEGQVVTPLVLGHRLALNPVAVFLGLIFWGWLWGPAGALLAVPVLVTLKIVCDHVRTLAPWSALLARA